MITSVGGVPVLPKLRLYQFNTKIAKHYFCSNCGIYTHHQRRSFPDQYGYN
ncbi:MAG: GFA family protein, partial [Betaproteobacteria bacterium]|nr:GFA family protein [Betaproteobacteria bacterium]